MPDRQSIRLKNYDYTRNGAYYITICAYERRCIFGAIENGEMEPNEIGKLVIREWSETAKMRPHVNIDSFVLMPNHLHGILLLMDPEQVERRPAAISPNQEQFGQPVSGSVPTIIRSFKAGVTSQVRKLPGLETTRVWQKGYYEHIIRFENELMELRTYIRNNPLKWELDSLNPKRSAN